MGENLVINHCLGTNGIDNAKSRQANYFRNGI